MPDTTAPAGWQTLGNRLTAQVDTLHTRIQQLIAAGVNNPQLDEQATTASMTASEIARLLIGLERNFKTTTNRPA